MEDFQARLRRAQAAVLGAGAAAAGGIARGARRAGEAAGAAERNVRSALRHPPPEPPVFGPPTAAEAWKQARRPTQSFKRLLPAAAASQAVVAVIQEVAPGEYGAIVAMLHSLPLVVSLLAHESPVAAVIATLTASGIRIFLQSLITFMRAVREYAVADKADRPSLRRAYLAFITPAWATKDVKEKVALHAANIATKDLAMHKQKVWWQYVRGDPPQQPQGAKPLKKAKKAK